MGGAIYNYKGYVTIKEKNIFKKNSAGWWGGAIRNCQGTLNIDKSKNVFKNNTPEDISEE